MHEKRMNKNRKNENLLVNEILNYLNTESVSIFTLLPFESVSVFSDFKIFTSYKFKKQQSGFVCNVKRKKKKRSLY